MLRDSSPNSLSMDKGDPREGESVRFWAEARNSTTTRGGRQGAGVVRLLIVVLNEDRAPRAELVYLATRTVPESALETDAGWATWTQSVSRSFLGRKGKGKGKGKGKKATIPLIGSGLIWLPRPPISADEVEAYFREMEDSIAQAEVERLAARRRKQKRANGNVGELIERDGPECCWCGRETDPLADRSAPNRATVEHVIPKALGGSRSFRNLRVACFQCNSERGAKDEHPKYALRPRGPARYGDPPMFLRKFELETAEDWEDGESEGDGVGVGAGIGGRVLVTAALAGRGRRNCTVYVKGLTGVVQMVACWPNRAESDVHRLVEFADALAEFQPLTFEGLHELGFRWVTYSEPKAIRDQLQARGLTPR